MPLNPDGYWVDSNGNAVYCLMCGANTVAVDTHYDYECDECGAEVWECVNYGEHYCESEEEEFDPYSHGGIYGYSYRPSLHFHEIPGESVPFHIGVELEIGARSGPDAIYEWARSNGIPDLFYCKEDSSVSGFEIVTHPMSPGFFDSIDWEGFFDVLNSEIPCPFGPDESSEHGIHVHVSRSAFSRTSQVAAWNYLLNRNAASVERIARRNASSWARFTTHPVSEVLVNLGTDGSGNVRYRNDRHGQSLFQRRVPVYCDCEACLRWPESARNVLSYTIVTNPRYASGSMGAMTRATERIGYGLGRYSAINLQSDHQTYEVRVFRSTRNPADFRESVEFVVSSVEYVRSMQRQHMPIREALSWDAFEAFDAHRYADLTPAPSAASAA